MSLQSVLTVESVNKTYSSGLVALKDINLEINKGEIFALLGPNGAGKTTLISIICGIVNMSSGTIKANDLNIISDYRKTRAQIGLVPQEISTDMFETVIHTVNFSRGLFGKAPSPEYIEQLLKDLSLWEKKDSKLLSLSGGMKRRVMIAKALSHEPEILFLDEPTAGVDVELRQDMWDMVRGLKNKGVTIILTTHYIEEAEEMADRIGVINKGEIIIVDDKKSLMKKLGKKQLTLTLQESMTTIPEALSAYQLELANAGNELIYTYSTQNDDTGIAPLLKQLNEQGINFSDINSTESSLEEIFVNLVRGQQ
ncbi:MAG: ABC transporter ATP-binding protein [Pseudomonadota bacterium]